MSQTSTILLVEDNDALREMFRRRLTRAQFSVEVASDGESALRAASHLPPDLILLDLSLPGKSGWELASELKSSASSARIPIIAITAHAMRGDRGRALRAGCDDYVSKPVDFVLLLGLIRKHLGL